MNLARLVWKPASPQVWLRQLPFRQVKASCPVTAMLCLLPRHPPCVYMSLSDRREEAHDLGGFGFSSLFNLAFIEADGVNWISVPQSHCCAT